MRWRTGGTRESDGERKEQMRAEGGEKNGETREEYRRENRQSQSEDEGKKNGEKAWRERDTKAQYDKDRQTPEPDVGFMGFQPAAPQSFQPTNASWRQRQSERQGLPKPFPSDFQGVASTSAFVSIF